MVQSVSVAGLVEVHGVRDVRGQLRDIAVVLVATLAMILFFVGVAVMSGEEFRFLSKEPAETLHAPKFVGAFAHAVVLLWVPAAVTGIVAGWLHRSVGQTRRAAFFLVAGGLSVALLMDDLFMFHEFVYPGLGVPELVVYAGYAAAGLLFVATFWGDLVESGALLMVVVGGAFLAASIGLDIVVPVAETVHVLEDGSKAIGVAMWTVAITRAAVGDLRPRLRA